MKKILILSILLCACCSVDTASLPADDIQHAKGDAIKGPVIKGPVIIPSQDAGVAEEEDVDTNDDTTEVPRG